MDHVFLHCYEQDDIAECSNRCQGTSIHCVKYYLVDDVIGLREACTAAVQVNAKQDCDTEIGSKTRCEPHNNPRFKCGAISDDFSIWNHSKSITGDVEGQAKLNHYQHEDGCYKVPLLWREEVKST